jgi:hypothetical protein
MALLSAESVHVAPFTHGDESHSSTSTSQLPLLNECATLWLTVHAAVYSLM